MTYRVVLTANAKANLAHYYDRAAQQAPETALRWLNRFHEALETLSSQPDRCPHAPENDAVKVEVRQFRFGKRAGAYRVLFSIGEQEVRILHVRRAAMGKASADDLESRL